MPNPYEWVTLNADREIVVAYCYQPDSPMPHRIQHGEYPGLDLTNAEAVAFARQLPEVKALVEANRPAYHSQWPHDLYGIIADDDFELAERFAALMHHLHMALAPFEEARDEPPVAEPEFPVYYDAQGREHAEF